MVSTNTNTDNSICSQLNSFKYSYLKLIIHFMKVGFGFFI